MGSRAVRARAGRADAGPFVRAGVGLDLDSAGSLDDDWRRRVGGAGHRRTATAQPADQLPPADGSRVRFGQHQPDPQLPGALRGELHAAVLSGTVAWLLGYQVGSAADAIAAYPCGGRPV